VRKWRCGGDGGRGGGGGDGGGWMEADKTEGWEIG